MAFPRLFYISIHTQVEIDLRTTFHLCPLPLLPMTLRVFSSLTGTLVFVLALSIAPVQAQNWSQEIQVITTVRNGEPLQVFTDSLSAMFFRHPEVLVRREVTDAIPMPAAQLRDQLYADGVDINSATHALIRYQFELRGDSEIVETIKGIYFIYRGSESQADLPILYLNPAEPFINNVIRTRGIPSLMNMEVVDTFREMFAFPYLNERQETAMIEISGRSLRGYTVTPEQRILEEFLTDHLNMGGGSYVLSLPEPAEVAALDASAADSTTNVSVLPVEEQ